jgi:hypothetical protein
LIIHRKKLAKAQKKQAIHTEKQRQAQRVKQLEGLGGSIGNATQE